MRGAPRDVLSHTQSGWTVQSVGLVALSFCGFRSSKEDFCSPRGCEDEPPLKRLGVHARRISCESDTKAKRGGRENLAPAAGAFHKEALPARNFTFRSLTRALLVPLRIVKGIHPPGLELLTSSPS